MCTKDNRRLWFLVKVEDETDNFIIYIREKAALSLAHADSKEDFEAARADDSLDFPPKASIKIIRKPAAPRTPTVEDDNAQVETPNCYIVEAAVQSIEDTPSKSSLILLKLLEQTDARTDVYVPAGISMIKKDPHYGLSVSYKTADQVIKKRCTRAVATCAQPMPRNQTT